MKPDLYQIDLDCKIAVLEIIDVMTGEELSILGFVA